MSNAISGHGDQREARRVIRGRTYDPNGPIQAAQQALMGALQSFASVRGLRQRRSDELSWSPELTQKIRRYGVATTLPPIRRSALEDSGRAGAGALVVGLPTLPTFSLNAHCLSDYRTPPLRRWKTSCTSPLSSSSLESTRRAKVSNAVRAAVRPSSSARIFSRSRLRSSAPSSAIA